MQFTALEKKEILFGTLLGNAYLQTYTGGSTWRARFLQSNQHKPFLFHLYSIFSSYVKTPPRCSFDLCGNIRWSFNTTVQPELNELAKFFYPNKKKVVPTKEILLKYLTPLAISYWFMDNGTLKSNKKAYYLCTDRFSPLEIKILAEVFLEKYNISLSIHKKGKFQRIYIPESEYQRFKNVIISYIHTSMYYKIPQVELFIT